MVHLGRLLRGLLEWLCIFGLFIFIYEVGLYWFGSQWLPEVIRSADWMSRNGTVGIIGLLTCVGVSLLLRVFPERREWGQKKHSGAFDSWTVGHFVVGVLLGMIFKSVTPFPLMLIFGWELFEFITGHKRWMKEIPNNIVDIVGSLLGVLLGIWLQTAYPLPL